MTSAAQLQLPIPERMFRANAAVAEAMLPVGSWWTLSELSMRAKRYGSNLSEGSVSSRISENDRWYGLKYEKRRLGSGYGNEYRRLT